MSASLRPLTTIEVLDAAWLVLRRHALSLYAGAGLGAVPLALLLFGYFGWLGTLVARTGEDGFYAGTALWSLAMAGAWALNGIARAAVTAMALAALRGEPVLFGSAWRSAWRLGGSGALLALLPFATMGLAVGCLAFPALILAAGWSVARPVLLAEERRGLAALRRSWALTAGHRLRSAALWFLLLGLGAVGALNLHLLAGFLVEHGAGLLGLDASVWKLQLRFGNPAWALLVIVLAFLALEPLRAVADAVFYMDLRIRREGADLQERLRALRSALPALLGAALLLPAPARAETLAPEEYRERVRALAAQLRVAADAEGVDRALVDSLRQARVRMPGGEVVVVENGWLGRGLSEWRRTGRRDPLLARLEGLDRSLGANGAATGGAAPDPRRVLRDILAEPEFRPLAERPELERLLAGLDLERPRAWWQRLWDRIARWFSRFRLPAARVGAASPVVEGLVYLLLALGAGTLLALVVRWYVERPARAAAPTASAPGEPVLSRAARTENALDHGAEDWERFAREWLRRGDLRQAIRALYLAGLVRLHRERRIDYDRALTNWVYVRRFRGAPEQRRRFAELTRRFDEIWYGERPCDEAAYRRFEEGLRALVAPGGSAGDRSGEALP